MTTYLLGRSKCSSSQCSNWEKKETSDQQHQQLNILEMIYSLLGLCMHMMPHAAPSASVYAGSPKNSESETKYLACEEVLSTFEL